MNFLTLDLKIFTLSEWRISKGNWFHMSIIQCKKTILKDNSSGIFLL